MLVYRFQNDAGRGPYCGGTLDYIKHHNNDYECHPTIHSDELLHNQVYNRNLKNFIFGFISIEQVNRWFTKDEQDKLAQDGFELVTLEVPDEKVAYSEFQCVFERSPCDETIL